MMRPRHTKTRFGYDDVELSLVGCSTPSVCRGQAPQILRYETVLPEKWDCFPRRRKLTARNTSSQSGAGA